MTEVPYGFCHCGCGQRTKLAMMTNKERGHVKGEPLRYIHGHSGGRLALPADAEPPLCECCGKPREWEKDASVSVGGSWVCPLKRAARRETKRRYNRSERGRELNRRYKASEKGKAKQRRYKQSEKAKAMQKRRDARRIWISPDHGYIRLSEEEMHLLPTIYSHVRARKAEFYAIKKAEKEEFNESLA